MLKIEMYVYLAYDVKSQSPIGIFQELKDAEEAIIKDRKKSIKDYNDWNLTKRLEYWVTFDKRIERHDDTNIYWSYGEYRYKIHRILI